MKKLHERRKQKRRNVMPGIPLSALLFGKVIGDVFSLLSEGLKENGLKEKQVTEDADFEVIQPKQLPGPSGNVENLTG